MSQPTVRPPYAAPTMPPPPPGKLDQLIVEARIAASFERVMAKLPSYGPDIEATVGTLFQAPRVIQDLRVATVMEMDNDRLDWIVGHEIMHDVFRRRAVANIAVDAIIDSTLPPRK